MTTQPFPNDSEAESCIFCYGREDDGCGNCNGTGRGEDWASCEDCGETTWDHETGAYQQCQACRLAEWEAEKERRAVDAYDAAYEKAMRRADREAALAEDAHERMLEGMR